MINVLDNINKNIFSDIVPMFLTLAILDKACTEPETNISIPSAIAVEDAKSWVDENQK